jgi:hypothetical protein
MENVQFNEDNTAATLQASFPDFLDLEIEVEGGVDYVDIGYDITNRGQQFMKSTVEMCLTLLFAPNFRDHDGDRTYILTDEGFKRRNNVHNVPFFRLWCQDFTVDEISQTSVIAPLMQKELIATVSRDAEWVIAPTSLSGNPARLFNNWEYSCLHALPYSAAYPGERVQVRQRVYFLRGGLGALKARYERDCAQVPIAKVLESGATGVSP